MHLTSYISARKLATLRSKLRQAGLDPLIARGDESETSTKSFGAYAANILARAAVRGVHREVKALLGVS